MLTLAQELLKSFELFKMEDIVEKYSKFGSKEPNVPLLTLRLTQFKEMLNTISTEVDTSNEIIFKQVSDFNWAEEEDFEEKLYWDLYVMDKVTNDGIEYSISFIPFEELLRYSSIDFKYEIDFLVEIVWEITFDGYTIDSQNERIDAFKSRLNDLDI